MKTIIEPFKIKVIEPIKMTTPEQREELIKQANYNVFQLPFDVSASKPITTPQESETQ